MTQAVGGDYLGMRLEISALDAENRAYFGYCAQHELRLQRCDACALLRYPPGTGCPSCAHAHSTWTAVAGRGSVYSYTEVRHPLQPAFAPHVPYLVLLVELDTQRGAPGEHDALRMLGNLVTPEAALAPPEMVAAIGIGTRVRIVFHAVSEGLAVPLWTVDESAASQPVPWRYPE